MYPSKLDRALELLHERLSALDAIEIAYQDRERSGAWSESRLSRWIDDTRSCLVSIRSGEAKRFDRAVHDYPPIMVEQAVAEYRAFLLSLEEDLLAQPSSIIEPIAPEVAERAQAALATIAERLDALVSLHKAARHEGLRGPEVVTSSLDRWLQATVQIIQDGVSPREAQQLPKQGFYAKPGLPHHAYFYERVGAYHQFLERLRADIQARPDTVAPPPTKTSDALPGDELKLIAALQAVVPEAAASYEQAVRDLRGTRLSWRGPACDLREALRECLDALAPDDQVTAQTWYVQDPNTQGPTQRQKTRYVLQKRQAPEDVRRTADTAVEEVESSFGDFVRAIYQRSNKSTHTQRGQSEVAKLHRLVHVALADLLDVK